MCKKCGDSEHDDRILKPREGEMFSINATSIHDDDVKTVNKFITFARLITELRRSKEIQDNNG